MLPMRNSMVFGFPHIRRTLGAIALASAMGACMDGTGPSSTVLVPDSPFLAGVAGAGYTSVNETVDGTGTCANGNPNVNCNIYEAKQYVWLNGGPTAGAVGDGDYFFAVLAPSGQADANDGSAENLSDDFDTYQNRSFSVTGSTVTYGGTHDFDGTKIRLFPYEDTPNPGGVYILAICRISDPSVYPVEPSDCKYDAFKIKSEECPDCDPESNLEVIKWYDANTDGIRDGSEAVITGWQVFVNGFEFATPVAVFVAPGTHTVSEGTPNETNWMHTTATSVQVSVPPSVTVEFGNVCVGGGGGLTLGFWSNKNGGNRITSLGLLPGVLALNLRKANGAKLGSVSLANFQKFLLEASATNMANMLSAQLAAMHLNVASGGVNGGALIYAPGTNSANALGFATVNAIMAEANTLLGAGGATYLVILSGHADHARAEALKNALDNGNNNLNFVQPGPESCPFTFGTPA